MEKYVKPEIEIVDFCIRESIMIEYVSEVVDTDEITTIEYQNMENIGGTTQ